MTPAAQISAAIEVLAEIGNGSRSASDALKDWGRSHRFAGSKDRGAIAGLVYDTLRRKASASWLMADDTPRAQILGMLRLQRRWDLEEISALFSGERFAPAPLSADETDRLSNGLASDGPEAVAGDFHEWLAPSLHRIFGDQVVAEMQALAMRAPLDLRVNTLKARRDEVREALAHLSPEETPWSPIGLRIVTAENRRGPAIPSEPEFEKGTIEIQDEGSQLAALLAAVQPGEQVVDLCAGGGGKTLALAAQMKNSGQIYASDSNARRLAPIQERLERAGIRNAQVRMPRRDTDVLADLDEAVNCILVDAPCTGTGTWRRSPDTKWQMQPENLAARIADQASVLDRAARLMKPAGRIIYITCSILPDENDDSVAAFLVRHDGFRAVSCAEVLERAGLLPLKDAVRATIYGLQMSPLMTGTDGFYVSVLERKM